MSTLDGEGARSPKRKTALQRFFDQVKCWPIFLQYPIVMGLVGTAGAILFLLVAAIGHSLAVGPATAFQLYRPDYLPTVLLAAAVFI